LNIVSTATWLRGGLVLVCLIVITTPAQSAENEPVFQAGFAEADITPQAPVPMWGYASRHAALSDGSFDPLMAKAVVIEAGPEKLALVGTDIGRGPTAPMMEKIRQELADKAGINHVIISGSHSHHGPVIELTDRDGFGKGPFDASVQYAKELPDKLIAVILAADAARKPAKIGLAKTNTSLNRNRHSKRDKKATEPMLAVIRLDDLEGKPLGTIVNFAAHPTMIDDTIMKFSADYPGHMKRKVEKEFGGQCVFMQGSAGDLSPNPPTGVDFKPQPFGEALADEVLKLARDCKTEVPAKPSLKGKVDRYQFGMRVDLTNPLIGLAFQRAFFPELVRNFVEEAKDGIQPEMTTILLNGDLALVSGSGEFFCNHSNRLKERSYVDTLFLGYANGHNMYFPTIEAASEGGYGADPTVSPVELGAGEKMMNQALVNIYGFLGNFDPKPAKLPKAAAAK
jgi:hypothetical protein